MHSHSFGLWRARASNNKIIDLASVKHQQHLELNDPMILSTPHFGEDPLLKHRNDRNAQQSVVSK